MCNMVLLLDLKYAQILTFQSVCYNESAKLYELTFNKHKVRLINCTIISL
jgi:hypothetical protein